MYCKRCLAALPQSFRDMPAAPEAPSDPKPAVLEYASPRKKPNRCRRCFRKFDSDDPKTYLSTLALTPRQMVLRVILTTLIGIAAAFVVAFHQLVAHSGH